METPRRLVITGSGSGIGQRLAQNFASSGWDVWGLGRRPQEASFRTSVCDVADWSAVQMISERIAQEWGGLEALICCAGVQGAIGPTMTLDPAEWSDTVRVNLDGTFHAIRAFFPLFARSGKRAKIVCFSGGGATGPRPHFSAYAVAKAGVVRLVETLAHEWSQQNVDINAIAPGALPTRLTEETLALGPERVGAAEFASALKTTADGEEGFAKVFALTQFLLGTESDGITGRLLSAPWDPWKNLMDHREDLAKSDVYTLRRIVPEDRGLQW